MLIIALIVVALVLVGIDSYQVSMILSLRKEVEELKRKQRKPKGMLRDT